MCRTATTRTGTTRTATTRLIFSLCVIAAAVTSNARAQEAPRDAGRDAAKETALDWRRIGNSAIRTRSGELATGPVERVWFERESLAVETASGNIFLTDDFETWRPSRSKAPLSATAAATRGEQELVEADSDGIWRSLDGGRTWAGLNNTLPNLPVERILDSRPLRIASRNTIFEWQRDSWARVGDARAATARSWQDEADPLTTLAVRDGKLFRTVNGGDLWDDVTLNLAGTAIYGVTAHRESNSVYAATAAGVFMATLDLRAPVPGGSWRRLTGALPEAKALDVHLDDNGNQLFVAFEGWGIYAALAPHRRQLPSLVSAADLRPRPAAPGALLSILGPDALRVRGAVSMGSLAGETQLQVPFNAEGREVLLQLESAARNWSLSVPLERAAPAVFERDGAPMLIDGDSGVLLDGLRPARSGMRLQILATGLGRVRPEWPAGVEAPLEAPPAVEAPVRVLLDGQALEVTRAVLAPGYIGFYLVEALVPNLVNRGTAELSLEVAGRESNRVRVYIEP